MMSTMLRRAFVSLWALLLQTNWLTVVLRAQAIPWSNHSTLFLDLHFNSTTRVGRSVFLPQLFCSCNRTPEIGGGAFVGPAAFQDPKPRSNWLDRLQWSAIWRLKQLHSKMPTIRVGQLVYWDTPFGQWQKSGIQDGCALVGVLSDGSLRVSQLNSHRAGLYYCLLQDSEGHRILPYRLAHVAQARPRKRRGTQAYGDAVPQGQFEVAVAVSVVITFVAGFSLGALSRSFLEPCFYRLRAKHMAKVSRTRTYTETVHYRKRTTFRKGPPESPGVVPDAVAPSLTPPPHSLGPPKKAPRNVWSRQAEGAADVVAMPGSSCQGVCLPAALQDGTEDSSDQSDATVEIGNYMAIRGAAASREEQPQPALVEPSTCTTRQRVIKLYNYDDEGNPYEHVKDAKSESAPTMSQRSLSLTRLSTIMAAAATTDFSRVSLPLPPQDTVPKSEDLGDDMAAFKMSI